MKFHKLRATVAAASLVSMGACVFAADAPAETNMISQIGANAQKVTDALGLEFSGYMRSGFYGASNNAPKGGYSLGGSLQFFRLGNEGNNYLELKLGKRFDLGGGVKWGTYYMPYVFNGSNGTQQIYTDISGLEFAPNVSFWAGQRFHRISDVHILDNWLMQDGGDYGAGADGIAVGSAKLNVAIHTDGNTGNGNTSTNNARRVNFQLRDIDTNPGGKLNLTGAMINGNFAKGSAGGALGLLHNQSNFIIPGVNNQLFIQSSTGHAGMDGRFYNLDAAATAPSLVQSALGVVSTVAGTPAMPKPGAKQTRIAESINWQLGVFGGQAIMGYETLTPDASATTKNFSLGGRMSYGVAKNVKLLAELAATNSKTDGMATKTLNKGTLALALSPNTDFWTRPELRLYATRVNWNNAAGIISGRNNATTFGAQVEAWW